jgi:hypothetical protein
MNTITVRFPSCVPADVIRQTLAYIGGQVIEAAAVRSPAPVRKVAAKKASIEYRDLTVYDKKTGAVKREIDGVTVQKLIAKMEGNRKRYHNTDGRSSGHYWTATELAEVTRRRPDSYAQEYIRSFCSGLSHVKAQYTNGVTA